MSFAGENRQKARAIFNRLMKTRDLNFSVANIDIKLQKVLEADKKKEAILATIEITNPESAEAKALIEEFGGPGIIPDTNAQIHFTLKIAQGKKDVDDPGQQKIPGTEGDE